MTRLMTAQARGRSRAARQGGRRPAAGRRHRRSVGRDREGREARARSSYLPYTVPREGAGFNSRLFRYARTLVRAAAERPKPNTDAPARISRHRAAAHRAAACRRRCRSTRSSRSCTLSFSLERMREWLGPDAPDRAPAAGQGIARRLATRLIAGTEARPIPAVRMRLWNGGAAAVDASHDPMIELARSHRCRRLARVRKHYEDEVEAPIAAASEKIAHARFEAYGTSVAPGRHLHPAPELRHRAGLDGKRPARSSRSPTSSRLFERATGQEPVQGPGELADASKDSSTCRRRFDLSTNNDIVGGNSGSPLIDAEGQHRRPDVRRQHPLDRRRLLVRPGLNRAVAVDPAIMFEALRKVYKANELLARAGREVTPQAPGRRGRDPGPSAPRAPRCGISRASHPAPAARPASR